MQKNMATKADLVSMATKTDLIKLERRTKLYAAKQRVRITDAISKLATATPTRSEFEQLKHKVETYHLTS